MLYPVYGRHPWLRCSGDFRYESPGNTNNTVGHGVCPILCDTMISHCSLPARLWVPLIRFTSYICNNCSHMFFLAFMLSMLRGSTPLPYLPFQYEAASTSLSSDKTLRFTQLLNLSGDRFLVKSSDFLHGDDKTP